MGRVQPPSERSSLTFGVSRSHSNLALLEGVRQLGQVLHALLKIPIKPIVARDYQHLLTSTTSGTVDLAWMPPLVCARALASGAELVAVNERQGAVTYRGGILVRADSALRTVAELRQVRAAWTDPSSAGGCVLPRLYLRAHHPRPDALFASERYYGSSPAACGAVADGEADLCSSFVRETSAQDPALAMADVAGVYSAAPWRLRILAITDSIASDGIVVGGHVAKAQLSRVADALLQLHTRADGKAALQQLMNSDRLVRGTKAIDQSLLVLQQRLAAG